LLGGFVPFFWPPFIRVCDGRRTPAGSLQRIYSGSAMV